jgi:hypothetical protein
MRLMVATFCLKVNILLPQAGGRIDRADQAFTTGGRIARNRAGIGVEILGVMPVIGHQEHGARRDPGVVLEEIGHLGGVDGLEAVRLEPLHQLIELVEADLAVPGDPVHRDRMEHDGHDHGPRDGIRRVPLVVQILAGVADVDLGRILGVEQRSLVVFGQRRRGPDRSGPLGFTQCRRWYGGLCRQWRNCLRDGRRDPGGGGFRRWRHGGASGGNDGQQYQG